jgi:hypothetical protein
MPCTRPEHCFPDGTCTAKPKCKAKHTVWEPGGGIGGGADCTVDNCGDGMQCGFSLFDVTELASEDWATLDARIEAGGRKRRGVCEETSPARVCSNDDSSGSPAPCPDIDGRPQSCRGYVLEAGRKF